MKTELRIIHAIEPSDAIVDTVLIRIKVIERKRATAKVALSSLCTAGAITISVIFIGDIIKEMHSTGFMEYASLLFSDSSIVLHNFREFSLVLIESLPEASTALALSTVVVLIVSLQSFARNIPRIRNPISRNTFAS